MIVCLCHRISDRDIRRAAEAGYDSFEDYQDETAIARNCACCEDCARDTFDAAQAACAGRARPVVVMRQAPAGERRVTASPAA